MKIGLKVVYLIKLQQTYKPLVRLFLFISILIIVLFLAAYFRKDVQSLFRKRGEEQSLKYTLRSQFVTLFLYNCVQVLFLFSFSTPRLSLLFILICIQALYVSFLREKLMLPSGKLYKLFYYCLLSQELSYGLFLLLLFAKTYFDTAALHLDDLLFVGNLTLFLL